MERITVESSILDWVCYLPELRILQVGLRTGKDYEYFEVPVNTYRGLLGSESKGRYYNQYIRKDFRFQPIKSLGAG
jgi:hypothetical protein